MSKSSPSRARAAREPTCHIEWLRLDALVPPARNARTHSKKQIRQIAASIQEFGFINPIIVDRQRRIIAGHGRLEAARLLELAEVPVIAAAHLSETAVRAYMLADNRLAEKAGWNQELLAIELRELTVLLPEINVDLGITGFEPAEIDSLFLDLAADAHTPADDVPAIDRRAALAREGDLFRLGNHRLQVGDARRPESYETFIRSERARMAFLDPPYNVKIDGHVGGRGRIKHREFVCASGEMSSEAFTEFLRESLSLCASHSADGAIHFVCMDWRHMGELIAARQGRLRRAEEPLHMDEEQRRPGLVLSLPARTRVRLQARHGTAREHIRARPARPHEIKRVALCRRQYFQGGPAG
jgi:hypothetical protein